MTGQCGGERKRTRGPIFAEGTEEGWPGLAGQVALRDARRCPRAAPRAQLPALPAAHLEPAPGGDRGPSDGDAQRRQALLPRQRGGGEGRSTRRARRARRTRDVAVARAHGRSGARADRLDGRTAAAAVEVAGERRAGASREAGPASRSEARAREDGAGAERPCRRASSSAAASSATGADARGGLPHIDRGRLRRRARRGGGPSAACGRAGRRGAGSRSRSSAGSKGVARDAAAGMAGRPGSGLVQRAGSGVARRAGSGVAGCAGRGEDHSGAGRGGGSFSSSARAGGGSCSARSRGGRCSTRSRGGSCSARSRGCCCSARSRAAARHKPERAWRVEAPRASSAAPAHPRARWSCAAASGIAAGGGQRRDPAAAQRQAVGPDHRHRSRDHQLLRRRGEGRQAVRDPVPRGLQHHPFGGRAQRQGQADGGPSRPQPAPDQPAQHRARSEASDRPPVQVPGGQRPPRPLQLRDRGGTARRGRGEDGRPGVLAAKDLVAGAGGGEGPRPALARVRDLAGGDHRPGLLQRQPAARGARGRRARRAGRRASTSPPPRRSPSPRAGRWSSG